MKLKFSWIPFLVSLCSIVPLRIYFALSGNSWDSSGIFGIIIAVLLGAIFLSVMMSETDVKILRPTRNIGLGIVSLLCTATFVWSGISYTLDPSLADTEQNPIQMAILSILSAVTFAMMSISFFTGKNLFKKLQVAIFVPAVACAFSMISFLSISNSTVSPYDVLQKSLMVLFLFYQSEVFVTFSDRGVVKRIFSFGLPFIIASAMFSIPNLINQLKDGFDYKYTTVSNSVLSICLAVYAVYLLLECLSQVDSNENSQYDISSGSDKTQSLQ